MKNITTSDSGTSNMHPATVSTGTSTQYQSRFTNSSRKYSNSQNSILFPPVVDAFTASEKHAMKGSLPMQQQQQQQQQQQRSHRVLAYGDSLTAGTCGNQYFPYSVYLEQALFERQQLEPSQDGTNKQYRNIVARHRGIPGMKVQEMVDNLDDERRGLRNALQSTSNPSLSIVIILAGTNDLGYELMYHNNNVERAAQTIYNNIITLHHVCYDNHVPYTIAVGIPSSGYQYRISDAAKVVSIVNTQLQQYTTTIKTTATLSETETTNDPIIAKSSSSSSFSPMDDQGRSRMIYMEFPFEYVPNGENWHSDTLHFSKKGYQVLGESLVPLVEQIVHQYLSGTK
jgi:lysophospholipase L1-like esterase